MPRDPIDGPILTEDALDRLEAAWREQAAPIAPSLSPGLTAAELEQGSDELQLEFPPEARLWWLWHSGTSGEPFDWLTRVIGPGLEIYTFDSAVDEYRLQLRIADQVAASVGCDPAEFWHRTWFPIVHSSGSVALDCTSPEAVRTPVLVVNWGSDTTSAHPKATSLGAVVALWTTALEQGWWTYDPDTASWERDNELITLEHDLSRLI